MVAIDVGSECIDRAVYLAGQVTIVEKANPANLSGNITSVCIYVKITGGGGWYLGIFYPIGTNQLKCRSAYGPFTVSVGLNTISVNMPIVADDYIGAYLPTTGEQIEQDSDGYPGFWYAFDVNNCIVDNESYYSSDSIKSSSIYGTGITPLGKSFGYVF